MASIDDPVERLVDMAMQAQMRLMIAYMDNMREQFSRELRAAVQGEMGGEQLYFGKGRDDRNGTRDQAMRGDRVAGLSVRALAKKYHVSKTQVARIVGAAETEFAAPPLE